MEPGDYVIKLHGARDRGKRGLILKIVHGGPGNILAEVLTKNGKTEHWPMQHLHIVNKGE